MSFREAIWGSEKSFLDCSPYEVICHGCFCRCQSLASMEPIKLGFMQQNSIAYLLNSGMHKDSIASASVWNPVLALLKISFMQSHSIALLLNKSMCPDSITSGAAWNAVVALLAVWLVQPNTHTNQIQKG
jgi:hypothetical protein